jgi:DNA-binding CsgD family transcriptional regulator
MTAGVAFASSRLVELAGQAVEAADFSSRVDATLGQVFQYDGWCLFGLDPETGLRTVQFGGRGTERTAEMARNEALMPDVNKYRDLAVARVPAGWLSMAHPEARQSFRLNEVLLPLQFHSELRVALREQGRLWGGLTLFRDRKRRPFDDHDVAAVCAIAPALTRALRAYPVRAVPDRGAAPACGVVALSPDNRLLAVSPQAEAWLNDLVPGGDDETYLSDVTRVLFDAAHAVRRGDLDRAAACVRTVSGHWLRVEGSELSVGEADVVIMLQAATAQQLLGTMSLYHGLTGRESEVLDLVARGRSSKQIARRLAISVLTVNGHLRSVYRKCGAAGREDLVGRLT